MLVDAGGDQSVGCLRREQQVIDPNAVVLLPSARLVVPEGEGTGTVAAGADRVGEPKVAERAEFVPRARQEQSVRRPLLRVARIEHARDDVEIAREDQRLLQPKALACVANKPLHPADLVGVFVGFRRVAIGQIDGRDDQIADLGFDIAAMRILGIAGQAALALHGLLAPGQHRDAVERLLTVHCNIVAQRLDRLARERVVDALGLLQTDDVGLPL